MALVATLAVAELGWLAERGQPTFPGFGDALIRAAASVVALQGDPLPKTAAGRLVMLGGFSVGLVLVARSREGSRHTSSRSVGSVPRPIGEGVSPCPRAGRAKTRVPWA